MPEKCDVCVSAQALYAAGRLSWGLILNYAVHVAIDHRIVGGEIAPQQELLPMESQVDEEDG